jgi:hypothetical protein
LRPMILLIRVIFYDDVFYDAIIELYDVIIELFL